MEHWRSVVGQKEQDLNRLIGQIKGTADGLAERRHDLEEQCATRRLEVESLEREAMAWDLLRALLQEEHQRMVDAVIEPVQRAVEPWISRLTSGRHQSVEIDAKGLQPVGLISGDSTLDIGREVSQGTEEQIALLSRLALATLLVAGDQRQVLVLDDPLVNSDPERQQVAWEIICEAGDKLQLLIMTCHPVPPAIRHRVNMIDLTALPGPGDASKAGR